MIVWRAPFRGLILLASLGVASVIAQTSAPAESIGIHDQPIRSVLVERAEIAGYVDQDPPGPSAGDMFIWGPNPLYDAENVIFSGASALGSCTVFNAGSDCIVVESIVFESGGRLEVRGLLPGDLTAAVWTIVGGAGNFQGATGTVTVRASAGPTTWIRTFEIWL